MKIQTLKTPAGEEMIVMSRKDYLTLLALGGDEEAEDELCSIIVEERKDDPRLTAQETKEILDKILSDGLKVEHSEPKAA